MLVVVTLLGTSLAMSNPQDPSQKPTPSMSNCIQYVLPLPNLCGIQAVRVSVTDSGHLIKSPTPPAVSLTSEFAGYLSQQGVPVATPDNAEAPLILIDIREAPLPPDRLWLIVSQFHESCSALRRPGAVIQDCETWQMQPSVSVIRSGDEVHAILKAIADNFARVYSSTGRYACSPP
jgi:hypothetical protein